MQTYCDEELIQHYRDRGVACGDIFKYVDEYGFILQAPLHELLEAIYIPVSASDRFCAQLDELLALKGYDFRCKRTEVPAD